MYKKKSWSQQIKISDIQESNLGKGIVVKCETACTITWANTVQRWPLYNV